MLDKIEVAEFGSGSGLPIALLHEGLGSVAMWRNFPQRLAETTGRRVIAWSRRGYGTSARFEQAYDPNYMHSEADAGARLLQALGIDHAHLFGHSDGASIALLMAARHPQLAASLVLAAPHVFVETMCVQRIAELGKTSSETGIIERLRKFHRDANGVFWRWHNIWVDPQFADWSIESDIAGLTVPALVIQGDDDEYGTFSQLQRIALLMSDARELRLERCGHSPHRDHEDAVLDEVAKFLGSLPRGDSLEDPIHE